MKTVFISLGVILCVACINQNNNKVTSALPSFTEIVDGQTTFSNSSITCILSLQQLPETLKFNNVQLNDNALEYEWGVYFDNNNDGKYDLSLSVSHWKDPENNELKGEILKNTQFSIWRISSEGGSKIGDLHAKIDENKIILTAPNDSKELNEISSNSKIKYQTIYNNGLEIYKDSLVMKNIR